MLMEKVYIAAKQCVQVRKQRGAKGRVSLSCFNTQRIHKHFQLFKRLQLLMEPVATEDNVVKWTLNQLFLDKKAASGGPTSTRWPKIFNYFNTNHGITILSRPVMIRHTWFACTLPSPPCACRCTKGQSSATSRDPTVPGQNHTAPTGLPVRRIDQFSVPGLSSIIGPDKNFPVLMRPKLKTLISDGHLVSASGPTSRTGSNTGPYRSRGEGNVGNLKWKVQQICCPFQTVP